MRKWVLMIVLVQSLLINNASSADLIAKVPWDSGDGGEFTVNINEERNKEEMTVREISFVSKESGQIERFSTPDGFFSAFTLQDVGGCLTTLWTTGSAYRVWVFQVSKGTVQPVLEVWSKSPPAVIPTEECPAFNFDEGVDGRSFKWTGSVYTQEPRNLDEVKTGSKIENDEVKK